MGSMGFVMYGMPFVFYPYKVAFENPFEFLDNQAKAGQKEKVTC